LANNRKRITEEEIRRLYYEEDLNFRQISEKVGYTAEHIRRLSKKYGLDRKSCVDVNFFKKDSPEFYYVLGLWSADGWVDGSGRIGIELADKQVIDWLASAISYKNSISVRKRGVNSNKTYSIRFQDETVRNVFKEYGISNKKKPEVAARDVPSEYFKDFVRGLFDGDGCAFMGKRHGRLDSYLYRFDISNKSKPFLSQVFERMKLCVDLGGLRVVESKTPTGRPFYRLATTRVGDIARIAEWLYEDSSSFCLTRKKDIMYKIHERDKFLRGVA